MLESAHTEPQSVLFLITVVNIVSLLSIQNRLQEVPITRLVLFSCQIAEGMEYLVCISAGQYNEYILYRGYILYVVI